MNLGIFLFTLARLVTLNSALSLFFMIIVMPAFLGMTMKTAHSEVSEILSPSMFETVLPLVIGYILVADNVANSKNLNDGEYLSLMFTRPISRSCYVISKWVAGTLGVTLCVYIAYASFLLSSLASGHALVPEAVEIVNILFNSTSAVALVVLVSAVPLRLGVILLVIIFYVSGFGPIFNTYSVKTTATGPNFIAGFAYVIGIALQFLQSFVHQTIDINEMVNSVTFSWKPLVNYLSNVTIYLLLAIFIMNKREFYYASE